MDLTGCDRDKIFRELKQRLTDGVTDFSFSLEKIAETAAELDEACMNEFLDRGTVSDEALSEAIAKRHVFPCFFGSAPPRR